MGLGTAGEIGDDDQEVSAIYGGALESVLEQCAHGTFRKYLGFAALTGKGYGYHIVVAPSYTPL